MHISIFRPGAITFGLCGSPSNQFRKLFSAIPVPGTTTADPKPAPRLCVIATALPAASIALKCVVHSVRIHRRGSPASTSSSIFSDVYRSPPEGRACEPISARRCAAYSFDSRPAVGTSSSPVYSALSACANFAASINRCNVPARLWPISATSKPSMMFSVSRYCTAWHGGGGAYTRNPLYDTETGSCHSTAKSSRSRCVISPPFSSM